MDTPIPASEFTRNFGRYRMRAQREPVAVSSHGQITGYFIGPDEYEEFKHFRESRRSFATAERPRKGRGDPRLGHGSPARRSRQIARSPIAEVQ